MEGLHPRATPWIGRHCVWLEVPYSLNMYSRYCTQCICSSWESNILKLVQTLFDLEATNQELKPVLRDLYITSAQEIETGARKAIVIHVRWIICLDPHSIKGNCLWLCYRALRHCWGHGITSPM
jgi:hypothetical protein